MQRDAGKIAEKAGRGRNQYHQQQKRYDNFLSKTHPPRRLALGLRYRRGLDWTVRAITLVAGWHRFVRSHARFPSAVRSCSKSHGLPNHRRRARGQYPVKFYLCCLCCFSRNGSDSILRDARPASLTRRPLLLKEPPDFDGQGAASDGQIRTQCAGKFGDAPVSREACNPQCPRSQ